MSSNLKGRIATYLLAVAVGFALCFTLISRSKEGKILKGDLVTVTKTDTLYIDKPYPIIFTKEVEVPVPYEKIKLDTVYIVDSSSRYRDTVEVEKDLSLTYDATVTGRLDRISLGYIDNRPDKIVKETTTVVKQAGVLYVGATTDIRFNSSVGLTYVKDRNMFGASVKLNSLPYSDPSKFNFTYSRKLF